MTRSTGKWRARLPARWAPAVAGFLAVLLWWGGEGAWADRTIDYLYIEANEADSSGGHAALRFGNQTFHFQYGEHGILRLHRDDSAIFTHVYADLGNRSVRESRIAVTDETNGILRDGFVRLLLVQDAQLETLDALHRDVTVLERLRERNRSGAPGAVPLQFPVRGGGYFLPGGRGPDADPREAGTAGDGYGSAALRALRERISRTHGENFLAERIARAERELRFLEVQASVPPLPLADDQLSPFAPPFSIRYENALLALHALRLVQTAPALRLGSYWSPAAESCRLSPPEMEALQHFAVQQETSLVRLIDSPRPDWGLPFIVGMARLAALELSLASGRLVLLDLFPAGEGEGRAAGDAVRPYLPAVSREMAEVFRRRRAEFFTATVRREADYAALERAGNRLLDLERAMAQGTSPRPVPDTTFPCRQAWVTAPVLPPSGEGRLEQELVAARNAEEQYRQALRDRYGYNLFTRNCVTEIFAVINHALERTAASGADRRAMLREESERRLGGFVDPSHGFVFIPFVSAGEVESSYAVAARTEHPSCRTARLAAMREREPPLTVFLRESNTLTSTVYRPAPADSPFLFFTDDAPLLRLPFGAVNLLVGLGTSILGIATLPVEGADRFLSGVKGMLFSLPELVFVNLRKGSMVFVEQSRQPSGSL